ncbi:hypothetical protein [Kitasatospora sp. NPDC094015]|uniref:hypothetical protein n=1 Tax=Kitasatospora sp. NPDC094015 TaxID=3155205 RepID=UPI0033282D3F
MAPYRYDRLVLDEEYRQRIRRHRPSSLLPLIAAAGARYGQPGQERAWLDSPFLKFTPWALADAARVALGAGTEFNRGTATDRDLLEILAAYSALMEPTLHSNGDDAIRMRDFLLRTAGEQFAWQNPTLPTLARTAAIYLQSPMPEHRTPKYLTPGWDTDLFGCALPDYVGAAQTLWGTVLACQGRFDPSYLDTPDGERICGVVSRETTLGILERHFAIDPAGFREAERRTAERLKKTPGAGHPQMRRFTHNPLHARPAVTGLPGSWLLCPVPQLVPRKVSPAGIYFTGMDRHGTGFTLETGYLFEQYIGRQLRLLPDAAVLPEITYTVRKQKLESVDWIVVFDDLVLLVEVKAAMPTENAHLGLADGVEESVAKIGRAYRQINKTESLIAGRHPAFAQIPTDRPRHGIIVTLEPFHTTNTPLPIPGLPAPALFTTVINAQEIEHLVTLTSTSAADVLLARASDPDRSAWDIGTVLHQHQASANPILEAAWDLYPWSTARRTATQADDRPHPDSGSAPPSTS